MAAATFIPAAPALDQSHAVSISSLGTLGIAAATLQVLGLAVLSSLVDRIRHFIGPTKIKTSLKMNALR
jgi:hypothetical protein